MKKLSQWATENGVSYHYAYRLYRHNKLPATIRAFKNAGGSILIEDTTRALAPVTHTSSITPQGVIWGSDDDSDSTPQRRNRAGSITRTDRFKNIEDSYSPFVSQNSTISTNEVITLCQKAYWNFSNFRNVIDLMTEFSVGKIYYKGGSKKARDFMTALFDKSAGIDFQDQFFREYYRSANVPLLRVDGLVDTDNVKSLKQVLGHDVNITAGSILNLPSRYLLVNPADISAGGDLLFGEATYFKVLNAYETERLRNPQTDREKEIVRGLTSEQKKQLGRRDTFMLPLPIDKFIMVFYKKQDYEPLAVPLGLSVLEDLNWKTELKKIDMAISRVMQQVILLITMGSELKDGTININQQQINAMRDLFSNESVGRVLVSSYDTKATFVIPQVSDILDPKKYAVVNEDIRAGLNNILIGEDKYANHASKIKLFVERLNLGRSDFLRHFLIPEIKRVARLMGFKNYPQPFFQKINIENNIEYAKIYTRLTELGVLTAEEGIKAIETGILPSPTESVESQQQYKDHRQDGLYLPITQKQGAGGEAGRPSGTPNDNKKITPIGGSTYYDVNKIKATLLSENELTQNIKSVLMKKHKIKKLQDNQLQFVQKLAQAIIANEPANRWSKVIDDYLKDPDKINLTQSNAINAIATQHQIEPYLASILYHSKLDPHIKVDE